MTPPTRLGTIGYVHGGSGTQTYFQANGGLFITGDVIVVTAFYNQPSGVTGIFPAGSVSLYAQTHASVGTFESHYFVIPAGWGGDFVGTTFPGGGTGVMLATFWRGCNPTAPAAVMVAPTFAIGNPNVSLASQTFSAEKELLSVTGGDDGAIDTYGPINWTSIQRGVDFRISLDLKRSTPTVTSPTGLITSYNDGGAQWLAAAVLQLVGTGSPAIVPAAIITPTRAVPLHRGFDSPLWSLMFRGRSPYVDGPAQYEIPRGYYDSAETEDWDSEEQVGLPVSFVALADPTAPEQDRFGRLVVEDAAATA